MSPQTEKIGLKQAMDINSSYIRYVARFVSYALLFLVILTTINTLIILSNAASVRWINQLLAKIPFDSAVEWLKSSV